MENKERNKKENQVKNKKGKMVKRQVSIITVFLWIFLVTTMIVITTSSIRKNNSIVEIDDDNWNVNLVMYDKSGTTPDEAITDFTWIPYAVDTGTKLTMQINYNLISKKEYNPGEIVIEIPGIPKDSFSELRSNWSYNNLVNIEKIEADEISSSTKKYEFSYSYDVENNLYTFVNNNKISSNENFIGTIQIGYNLKPYFKIRTELEFKAELKENISNQEEVIVKDSNICNFHYISQKTNYELTTIATAGEKAKYTKVEDIVNDYYWVKYRFYCNPRISQLITAMSEDGDIIYSRKCNVRANFSEGCIVYDRNFNKIEAKDNNTYYLNVTSIDSAFFVGYPKSKYNVDDEVTSVAKLYGRYENESKIQMLYEDMYKVKLKDFDTGIYGSLYDIKTASENDNVYMNGTNVGKASSAVIPIVFHTDDKVDVEIGIDYLNIIRENGEKEKISDTEYDFNRLDFSSFRTYNENTGNVGDSLIGYDYEIQVRYKNTNEYVILKEGVTNQYSETVEVNGKDIVGAKLIIKDLDKDLYSTYDRPVLRVGFNINTSDYKIGENVLENHTYLNIYKKDEAGNKTLVAEKEENGTINISDGEFGLLSGIVKKTENYNLKEKKYETEYFLENVINLLYFNVSKDCIIEQYYIVPKGLKLASSKEEILNSVVSKMSGSLRGVNNPYEKLKLKDGTLFNSEQELSNYIKENTTIDIDYNYKNSERSKISIKYNLKDIDWSWYLNQIVSGTQRFVIRCNVKLEIPYDNILEYGTSYDNYVYSMWNYDKYRYSMWHYDRSNEESDNGKYEDIAIDIDNDEDIEEKLVYNVDTLNISNVISSEQTVRIQVKTDLTNDEFIEGTAEASARSEYTYKLRVTTGANSLKDLILYDTLETTYDESGNEITEGWKGEFLGVNTEYAVSKGYAPKVYYSEEKNPGKITEVPDKWKELTDDTDKTKVKSICVDLRYNRGGSEMELSPNNVVFVLVNMKAPDDDTLLTSSYNMFSANFREIDSLNGIIGNIEEIQSNEVSIEINKEDIRKDISGTKTWNDLDNKYNLRPESITVKLLQDGQEYESKEVTEDTNWSYTFENVPVYKSNTLAYGYEIIEKEIPNYETTYEGYNITNSIKLKDLEVIAIWNDNNNEASKRPNSITLQVYDSDVLISEAEVNEESEWKHIFANLLKYRDNGEEITYTVNEKNFANDKFYVKEIVGNTITNTFTVPEDKIKIVGTKVWEDENNRAGKRPDSITLQVKENGIIITEQEVTENDNWSYEFELAKYDNLGNERVYTIDEKDTGNKFYKKELTNNTTVTNIFEVPNETIQVEAVKVWNDNENEAQKRPESIKLQIKAGGEVVDEAVVNDETEWKHIFTLPKYDSLGDEITYTVDEDYISEFYVKNIVGSTITNTFTVPNDKVKITGAKVWDDLNNFANKRDESVTLQLIGDNEVVAEQVVNNDNNWSYEFEAPKYDRYGNEVEYHIDEKDTGNKFYQKELTNTTTVTNRFEVPNEKKSIEVMNTWDDNNNEAQKRPTSIKLQVKRNGTVVEEAEVNNTNNWKHTFELSKYDERGDEIEYTVDEDYASEFYVKSIVGNVITNTFIVPEDKVKITGTKVWKDTGNAGGKRNDNVTLQLKNERDEVIAEGVVNERNNWSYEFETSKYDRLGNVVNYHIDERNTGNKFYQKELTNATTVTNTFVVPDEKVLVKAVKIWEDNNNKAGKRPSSVTLQLYNKDKKKAEQIVTEDNNWSFEVELPKYDELGDEITYTVDEKETSKFYEKEISGYVVRNRFIIPDEKINIEAVKVWDDNNNEAGKRPNSVILQIKRDGAVVEECEVSNTNEWKHTFILPKYSNLGNEIEYTVDEKETPKFYEKDIFEYVVTNRFSVPDEKVEIEAEAKWEDNDNESGKRPESIKLQVKLKGEVVDEFVVSETNSWKYKFELPKYDRLGNELTYTVDEDFISEFYIKEIVGNVITNKFVVPEDRVKITGTKIWEDEENKAGKRLDKVFLQLKVEDEVISEAEVSEANNWSYEFEVVKYDNLGNEINYYIDEKIDIESNSKFYVKELTDKNTVTNRFVVPDEKIIINAEKIWEDNNNESGKRPESVTLQVKSGDNVISEQIVNELNNWSYDFEVPKYDELGNEIIYTVDEKETVGDYIKELTGTTVINRLLYELPNTSDTKIYMYVLIFCASIIGIIMSIIKFNKRAYKK